MENINIKASQDGLFTPEVNFDAEKGHCIIEGESAFIETGQFFRPLIEWLEKFTKEVREPITFDFKISFFNTGSSRYILQILNLLKKYQDEGGSVTVNWHYDESNIDIAEEVQDFIIDTNLQINSITD